MSAVENMTLEAQIERAMWAGDVETLHRIAPCRCCCDEHTFSDCPARKWAGCRGGSEEIDHEAWARHYAKYHGMTEKQFFD